MSLPPPSQNSYHQSHYSMINQTLSTTNRMMDHSVVSSLKKSQVKDAHFHLYLPHLLLHDYSNPLTAFSANAQPLASPPGTQAMMTRVAFLTCSALLMISHHASTFPISTFSVIRSCGASIGCFVNPHKTRVLTSCNGTSILLNLTTRNPPLACSLSTSIASFSTTPHPTNKTAPDIPVELTTGFRLLGQPVHQAFWPTSRRHARLRECAKLRLQVLRVQLMSDACDSKKKIMRLKSGVQSEDPRAYYQVLICLMTIPRLS